MSLYDNMMEQAAKRAEQGREALKANTPLLQKMLNKEVRIEVKKFDNFDTQEYKGTITDYYGEYIELDNCKLISTKWISCIEILN